MKSAFLIGAFIPFFSMAAWASFDCVGSSVKIHVNIADNDYEAEDGGVPLLQTQDSAYQILDVQKSRGFKMYVPNTRDTNLVVRDNGKGVWTEDNVSQDVRCKKSSR